MNCILKKRTIIHDDLPLTMIVLFVGVSVAGR
jgi:hypothetical protein